MDVQVGLWPPTAQLSPHPALHTGKIPHALSFQRELEQSFPARLLLRASNLWESGYSVGSAKALRFQPHVTPCPRHPSGHTLNEQELMRVIPKVSSANSLLE